jgi:hypothetical protein
MLTTEPKVLGTHLFFFRNGDAITFFVATASRARSSNVATIVTATAHGLFTGAIVTLAGLGGAGYNQSNVTITVVNATTFTYANTGSNESTTADTAGTVTQTGTGSKTNRPSATDAGYIDLGVIEGASIQREPGDAIDVWQPNPGQFVLDDRIRVKGMMMVKAVTQEMTPFMVECLLRTNALTGSSTQFNPQEGPQKKGWLLMQCYDQADALTLLLHVYGELVIPGEVSIGAELVKPEWEFTVLHSTLNTGTL